MVGEEFSRSGGRDSHSYRTTLLCPHCGATTPIKFEFEGGSPVFTLGSKLEGFGGNYIVTCVACSEDIYIIVKNNVIEDQYPKNFTKVSSDVPQDIREDFEEANKCLNSGAYKASVAMLRRSLQNSCLQQEANPADNLVDQLKDLHGAGKIAKPLFDLATEIRFFGNYGAHPRDDKLDDVTQEDAVTMSRFLQQFFQYVYVMPAETARTKASRLQRKGKK